MMRRTALWLPAVFLSLPWGISGRGRGLWCDMEMGAARRRRQRIPRGAPLGAAPAGEARQKPWLGVDCGEKERRESGVRHGRVSVPLSCGGVKGLRWRVKEVIGKRFCGCRVGSGARAKRGRVPLWRNPDPDVGTDSQRGEAYLLPRSRLLRGRALRTTWPGGPAPFARRSLRPTPWDSTTAREPAGGSVPLRATGGRSPSSGRSGRGGSPWHGRRP